MKLDDFEDDIDSSVILQRGHAYYREKCVLSLEMVHTNHYKARVAGTQLYTVTLTLDDEREVEDIACTCPYDWGEYCKHEVAVLYALRHQLNSTPHTLVTRPKEVDLASLLEKESKKELLSYAKKSPELSSALVAAFPSPDEEVNQKNQSIQFRQAYDDDIERMPNEDDVYEWDEYEDEDWQFSSTFKKKIEELLGMARSAIQRGDIHHGGSIASIVVHELCSLDYDSETLLEEVEDVIMQVEALFDDSNLNANDATWLFGQFFSETSDYNDVPQEALLSLCFQFAEKESYEPTEWEPVLSGLLDDLQARDGAKHASLNRQKVYPEVLKGGGMLERLLSYIKKQPYLVRTYQDVLLPHYREEVFALYRTVILSKG